MSRQTLIARIHIAKARCMVCPVCGSLSFGSTDCGRCGSGRTLEPLSDNRYRALLQAVGGSASCSALSDPALMRVMDLFDRAGFSKAYPYTSPEAEMARGKRRVIWAIGSRAPQVLGSDWEKRVEGFVKKYFGKASLSFCDPTELRKVIGWVNRTAKYRKGKE